jgi:hypothetical protein
MTYTGVSPLYVLTGEPPPLTDAGAFTSYVTKNNVIGVTAKPADTLYVAAFIVFIAGLRQLIRHARPDGTCCLPGLRRGAWRWRRSPRLATCWPATAPWTPSASPTRSWSARSPRPPWSRSAPSASSPLDGAQISLIGTQRTASRQSGTGTLIGGSVRFARPSTDHGA